MTVCAKCIGTGEADTSDNTTVRCPRCGGEGRHADDLKPAAPVRPVPGTWWRHYKNDEVYVVLAVGKMEAHGIEGREQVIYHARDSRDGYQVWIRPLVEWEEVITSDGATRFSRVPFNSFPLLRRRTP